MNVNLISESEFLSKDHKDHGVHTAFLNYKHILIDLSIKTSINSLLPADIVHIHSPGIFSLFKAITSRHVVITAHLIPDSFIGSLVGSKYWLGLAKIYLRFFYNSGDLILAVSPTVKKKLEELEVQKKLVVFPNPIDKNVFKKDSQLRNEGRKKLHISLEKNVIVGVGQLQSRKGIEDFIETASVLPDYQFIWIGGRPFGNFTEQSTHLKKLLENPPHNFKNIQNIQYQDMPLLYNASDIFFFPSYQENAPMCVIEAASCKLPLILRDLPEYKTLYRHNYLRGSSIQEFTSLIISLKDKKNYTEAIKISEEISYDFSTQKLGKILIEEYERLLSI